MKRIMRAMALGSIMVGLVVAASSLRVDLPDEIVTPVGQMQKRLVAVSLTGPGGGPFSAPVTLLLSASGESGDVITTQAEADPDPGGLVQVELYIPSQADTVTLIAWATSAIVDDSRVFAEDRVYLDPILGARGGPVTLDVIGGGDDPLVFGPITMLLPSLVASLEIAEIGGNAPSDGYSLYAAPWSVQGPPINDPWSDPEGWDAIGVVDGLSHTPLYSWTSDSVLDVVVQNLAQVHRVGTATIRTNGDEARILVDDRAHVLGSIDLMAHPGVTTVEILDSGAIASGVVGRSESWKRSQAVQRCRWAVPAPDGTFRFGLLASGGYRLGLVVGGQVTAEASIDVTDGINYVSF